MGYSSLARTNHLKAQHGPVPVLLALQQFSQAAMSGPRACDSMIEGCGRPVGPEGKVVHASREGSFPGAGF